MEPTPNNHDAASSKRRRLDDASTPGSATIERIIGTATTSPLRLNSSPKPTDDENLEESQQLDDLPFTQDPSLHLFTNAASAAHSAVAAPPVPVNESTEFTPIVPLEAYHPIGRNRPRPCRNGFGDPRPFQSDRGD